MCEYCRERYISSEETEADQPKDIINIGDGSLSISATVLVDALHINVTSEVREENKTTTLESDINIWTAADINYCPMCGRKLRG